MCEKKNRPGGGKLRKLKKALIVSIIALSLLVAVVLAVQLGVFYGGPVTTIELEGEITYSPTNSSVATWTLTLSNVPAGDDWFSRFEVQAGGYVGPVTITWVLQEEISSVWTDTAFSETTTFTLSGAVQNIYASSNGAIGTNWNWGLNTTTVGTWRIVASVDA